MWLTSLHVLLIQLLVLTKTTNGILTCINAQEKNPLSDGETLDNKRLWYFLVWDKHNKHFGNGQFIFQHNSCTYTNCYVTTNRYMKDIQLFDAIIFEETLLSYYAKSDLPKIRSQKQKYIFATTESPHYYPIRVPYFNNYFNWTMSYKLDSDIRWIYIKAYDSEGQVVAPKTVMHWREMEYNKKHDLDLEIKFSTKYKAAAWFVSNCDAPSKRGIFAEKIIKKLRSQYNLTVDVYGNCSRVYCYENCYQKLREDYFFYFAFENSFAEDYVTEKLFTALHNSVIPVVYGGANYSRFLPPNSYLNARELGVTKTAKAMSKIIRDPPRYRSFFRWTRYYSYKSTLDTICNLCAVFNNRKKQHSISVCNDFIQWWNGERKSISTTKTIGVSPKPHSGLLMYKGIRSRLFR